MIHLLGQKWAIAEDAATRYLGLLASGIALDRLVKKQSHEFLLTTVSAMAADTPISWDGPNQVAFTTTKRGRVAIIPVIGPMTKYGDLCSMGMQDYRRALSRVNADDEYEGTVLIMDTPGGTVDGTPEFALDVAQSHKPIVVFGDGTVASAGVYVASQASHFVVNKNNPTEVGSIGVILALPNVKNMQDAGNYPNVELFRATKSKNKARINALEQPDEVVRQEIQDSLDEVNSEFIASVKAGRGDRLDTKAEGLFDGTMFSAKQAKAIGLVDELGTLSGAINKVSQLAERGRKQRAASAAPSASAEVSNNQTQEETMSKTILARLREFVAGEEAAVSATETGEQPGETPQPTEQQPTAEDQLAAIRAEIDSIRQDTEATVSSLREQLQASEQQTATLRADLTAAQAEANTLREQLAAVRTAGAPQTGDQNFRSGEGQPVNRVKEAMNKKSGK